MRPHHTSACAALLLTCLVVFTACEHGLDPEKPFANPYEDIGAIQHKTLTDVWPEMQPLLHAGIDVPTLMHHAEAAAWTSMGEPTQPSYSQSANPPSADEQKLIEEVFSDPTSTLTWFGEPERAYLARIYAVLEGDPHFQGSQTARDIEAIANDAGRNLTGDSRDNVLLAAASIAATQQFVVELREGEFEPGSAMLALQLQDGDCGIDWGRMSAAGWIAGIAGGIGGGVVGAALGPPGIAAGAAAGFKAGTAAFVGGAISGMLGSAGWDVYNCIYDNAADEEEGDDG